MPSLWSWGIRREVAALGILRTGADLAHQPASHKGGETRAGGAGGEADLLSDFPDGEPGWGGNERDDSPVGRVERDWLHLTGTRRARRRRA